MHSEISFLIEENALWKIVIREFYGVNGGFGYSMNFNASGGIWQDIIKAVKLIENIDTSVKYFFTRKISSGADMMFWKDSWCGDGTCLMDKFQGYMPRNLIMIAWFVIDDVQLMEFGVDIDEGLNKWIWSKDSSGRFKVSPLSKSIRILSLSNYALDLQLVLISFRARLIFSPLLVLFVIATWRILSIASLNARRSSRFGKRFGVGGNSGLLFPSLPSPSPTLLLEKLKSTGVRKLQRLFRGPSILSFGPFRSG
uniref:RNA-directed DNA polymerase, eukaryota, reverse transcriptase zinc-binding domain protein n=1 Tax=Tanacetum cinerariifolium TaxID=118510 RepID=A0A6L2M4A5_TANCI|nr:RNA-directed DNA polymerase, eukaryota, reverse transcriptase zinc-binding domain protein [Tanacetum cinerariifolium]